MNAVIISIKDAYRIEEVPVQEEVETLMSNFYKMYCKFIGLEKLHGRYPVKVGRSAIPIAAFKLIAKKLFEMQNDRNWKPQIQIWPYWNTLGTVLSRSERVGHALIDHLGMKEDMILFDTQTSKTDPSGISTYAKCIASNPFEPHSDVFLGLAFLFFCRDSESDNHLFRMQTCLRQPRFICERYWIRSLSQKKLYWAVPKILWACIQPKKLGAPNFTTTNVLSLSPLKNDVTTRCKAVKVATLEIFHQMTPSTLEFWLVFRLEQTNFLRNLVILMVSRMTCGLAYRGPQLSKDITSFQRHANQ